MYFNTKTNTFTFFQAFFPPIHRILVIHSLQCTIVPSNTVLPHHVPFLLCIRRKLAEHNNNNYNYNYNNNYNYNYNNNNNNNNNNSSSSSSNNNSSKTLFLAGPNPNRVGSVTLTRDDQITAILGLCRSVAAALSKGWKRKTKAMSAPLRKEFFGPGSNQR
jgi:hypothetical protein